MKNKFIQYILDSKFYIYIYDKLSDMFIQLRIWWVFRDKYLSKDLITQQYLKWRM